MPPREKLPGEILRDRVALDETGQQALPEELHDRVSVPCLERVKRAVVREGAVGHHAMNANPHLRVMVSAAIRDDEVSRLYPRRYRSVRKGG